MKATDLDDGMNVADSLTTFNARLSAKTKETIQRAASLRGQSLTDFVISSAYERATQTIASETILQLSDRSAQAFAEAVAGPPDIREDVVDFFLDADRKSRSVTPA